MEYLFNDDWGFMFYPETDEDIQKVMELKKILGDDLEDVWAEIKDKNKPSHFCIAVRDEKIQETNYPHEASG